MKKTSKKKKVTLRNRTYTFKVECVLPNSSLGETRRLTSFVYGVKNLAEAKTKWFAENLDTARKNGLRGPTVRLQKKLKLDITRIPNSVIR